MKKILILLTFFTLNVLYANNKVLTSIQVTYSIAKNITKNTGIEVYSIFDSGVSMDYGKSAFDNKELDLSEAKNAVAVIDVAKVWGNDYLYEYARRQNIRIIEIDAGYSFSDNDYLSLSLLNYENEERNPYVWMSFQNGMKMSQIIAEDLIRLFPKEEKIILNNLKKFTVQLKEIDDRYLKETLNASSLSVISLTENLDYLLNEADIFTNHIQFNEVNTGNIGKIMKDSGSKVIVSDKWLKKEIILEIEKNGGKFLVLDTFNIPRELDEKMDPDAYLKGMNENVDKLIKALK